eukprot:4678187-Lingulodinium_polyedra.AAC.1
MKRGEAPGGAPPRRAGTPKCVLACAAAQARPPRGAALCRDSAGKSRLTASLGATLGQGARRPSAE